jgi:hypothetical protein
MNWVIHNDFSALISSRVSVFGPFRQTRLSKNSQVLEYFRVSSVITSIL